MYSPSPFVPPTKTATMPDGRLEAIRPFDALMRSSETIICLLSVDLIEVPGRYDGKQNEDNNRNIGVYVNDETS